MDGKQCPGEVKCSQNGPLSRTRNRTLEEVCSSCSLFETKPENTPRELVRAVEAAEDLREMHDLGFRFAFSELTAWEVAAYRAATQARRRFEDEIARRPPKDAGGK